MSIITDLQLRDDVSDECNFPIDDTIQTYRVTAAQIKDYILSASSIVTSMLQNGSVTRTKIADVERFPTGGIIPFSGTTAPTGYLLCNGSAVSRTTYAALFAIIGVSHGSGDGSTTFNIPDYRGRFLRGVDGGVARDPDRASRTAMNPGGNTGDNVGSIQNDQFKSHTHSFSYQGGGGSGSPYVSRAEQSSTANRSYSTGSAGGSETRPLNASVNYLIKY